MTPLQKSAFGRTWRRPDHAPEFMFTEGWNKLVRALNSAIASGDLTEWDAGNVLMGVQMNVMFEQTLQAHRDRQAAAVGAGVGDG